MTGLIRQLISITVAVSLVGCAHVEKDRDKTKVQKIASITTSRGVIRIRLHADETPNTCLNFEELASTGFYESLTFHRVVPNLVVQGGCPNGDGTGTPGYVFPKELHPELKHDGPGVVSMVSYSGSESNGSQFFITLAASPHLDGKNTVFGRVIEGQDVVNAIQEGDKIEDISVSTSGRP